MKQLDEDERRGWMLMQKIRASPGPPMTRRQQIERLLAEEAEENLKKQKRG